MKRLISVILLGLISFAELTPPLYAASRSTLNTFGRVQISQTLVTLPAVAADLTTKDTMLFQLTLSNITGGAVSVTITDKQSSPVTLMSVSIPAGTIVVVAWPEGQFMKGGVNWVAGAGSSINGSVFGFTT